MLDSASMREKLFTMRMSDDEAERLEAVAKHYALNAAGLLRMLVKREYDALRAAAGERSADKPTKKSKR